jgi:hypothetical protein
MRITALFADVAYIINAMMDTESTSETSANSARLHGTTTQESHFHTRSRENLIFHQA